MTVNMEELKGYLKIDKYALDDEVVNQATLLHRVSEAYVEAAADRDAFKEALATIEAKLDSEIRHDFGDDKFTEAQVKSKIQVHPKRDKAVTAYLEAKEIADQLGVLKDAFQVRGFMLRDLCTLHQSNYFEATSVRSTPNQDRVVYQQRRARLADAQKERYHAKERA